MVLRLSSFPVDVRAVVLSGLSTASAALVTAADNVLSAIGKLQAQSTINAQALDNIGRNKILNATFAIAQRGAGPWTASAIFTADRWQALHVGDTDSISLIALSDADRSAIGDESAVTALQATITGSATTANYSQISQRSENVRVLSGKTVSLSFWAKASAALNLGVFLQQNFGTGGSPSASLQTSASTIALSTSWTRYSLTLTLASSSGKTLGTNNDHGTAVFFSFSSGTTNASAYGVGAQSGTFSLWGVQLEIGPVISPLEVRPINYDLATCQRFYIAQELACLGYAGSNGTIYGQLAYPTQMRAVPSVAFGTISYTGTTSLVVVSVRATDVIASVTYNGGLGGTGQASTIATFSADI